MKPAHWQGWLRAGTLLAAGTAGSMLMLSAVAPAGATTAPGAPGGATTAPVPTPTGATASPSTTSPSTAKVAVPQGLSVAGLIGHSVFPGPIPGSTKETVSFVLKLRQANTLESDVEAGMHGGRYLSVREFANRYGQTRANLAALQKYLSHYHIKTTAYADRLDVSATGTARAFNTALSVTQGKYTTRAIPARGNQPARPAVTFHGTTDTPLMPKNIAGFVYAILGLTNYPVASSNAVHTPTPEVRSAPKGVQEGNRTPANFASEYGLTPLYQSGARGRGQTIGIITYASLNPSDASYFWSRVLKIKTLANRINLDYVDGGSGPVSFGSGSGETTLDVEQSGAIAPYAKIVVYQAPNTDFGSADAWFGAASQNLAGTISTSWGESEVLNEAIAANKTEAATYGGIFDEAALEMAAQGQSAFNAAGDAGAYDDVADPTGSYTGLSVDNPANSPWMTASGGTTNPGLIPLVVNGTIAKTVRISAQRTWGSDYLFPYYSLFGDPNQYSSTTFTSEPPFVEDPYYALGGGGGYSVIEKQPAYQSKIKGIDDYSYIPYVTPTHCPATPPASPAKLPAGCAAYPGSNLVLPTAWTAWDAANPSEAAPAPLQKVFSGRGGRAVPDIVADADPYTGYEEYFSKFPSVGYPRLAPGWGGTSFVAPQLNASAAVIDSFLHHRTGFWNPAIYRFAAVRSWTPFSPMDAGPNNDNLYYTGTAHHIYNPGSGLGVPNLDKLALDFRRHGG